MGKLGSFGTGEKQGLEERQQIEVEENAGNEIANF
jgi:hypothetical protein